VLEDGATVTDVARRYGVGRQAVDTWLRRYANEGSAGSLTAASGVALDFGSVNDAWIRGSRWISAYSDFSTFKSSALRGTPTLAPLVSRSALSSRRDRRDRDGRAGCGS
jgi:transposase-like protein